MAQYISNASLVKAAGNKEKIIKEIFGRVASGSSEVSIAHMKSPEGWEEPGQKPDFDEYTVVLKGTLCVKMRNNTFEVTEDQGILIEKGEWVRYSSPYAGGAEYISVCVPAFSPGAANRDQE